MMIPLICMRAFVCITCYKNVSMMETAIAATELFLDSVYMG